MADPIPFTLLYRSTDSRARRGRINLSRGTIQTPFFMPVGTHAAVKTQTPADMRRAGAQVVLSNAYHLYLRPGLDLLGRTGGLHPFMGWDGPILTDSGGYQVFSLAKLRKMDADGVTFQSHLDGSEHRFTPESVVQNQRIIGSDMMMPLDDCPSGDATPDTWRQAVERTTRWARRSRDQFAATESRYGHTQYLFGIVQGGTDPELRRRSAGELLELDPAGCAIGGLAVGEPKAALFDMTALVSELLPDDRPRYLMGVGTPADIVRAVGLGIDLFDCVLPTRNARNGQLFTPTGHLNIRNARYRDDLEPVQDGCGCDCCTTISRAYLRHLFTTEEVLGLRLATAHNLWFYLHLMAALRQAIEENRYSAWAADFLATYGEPAA